MTKFKLNISFDIDIKFWAITPAFNINIHSSTFEIEWLCFALYFDFTQEKSTEISEDGPWNYRTDDSRE